MAVLTALASSACLIELCSPLAGAHRFDRLFPYLRPVLQLFLRDGNWRLVAVLLALALLGQ